MASGDETLEAEPNVQLQLQGLYMKASTKKAAVTRQKKAFDFALAATREAPASEHFFEELKRNLSKYRELRDAVMDIYDSIRALVGESKYKKDFGKQESEIEGDYDKIEDAARIVLAAHHEAVQAMFGSDHRGAAGGGAPAPMPPPPWKLQASFQPKSPLKLDATTQDYQCWVREFHSYYDMSNLQRADVNIQKTVLMNCLHQDFQTKISESMSGATSIQAGLEVVEQEFRKRHPQIIRRHQLFCLDQQQDESKFSETVTRMLVLAKDAELVDMSRDQILCHILLRACSRDDELRAKLLEIDSDSMTLDRLIAIVERYELIQITNKGLGKGEKGHGRKVNSKEGNLCFCCQNPNAFHIARNCPVDKKTLFCKSCDALGLARPHSHNTFPHGNLTKAEEEAGKEKEGGKGRRVQARGLSPAGEPESSDDEQGFVRRVQAEEPKSDSSGCGSEDELDSGNFSDHMSIEEEEEEGEDMEEEGDDEDKEEEEEEWPLVETAAIRNRGRIVQKEPESSTWPESNSTQKQVVLNQLGTAPATLQCTCYIMLIVAAILVIKGLFGEVFLLQNMTAGWMEAGNWALLLCLTIILRVFGFTICHQRYTEGVERTSKESETEEFMEKMVERISFLEEELATRGVRRFRSRRRKKWKIRQKNIKHKDIDGVKEEASHGEG